MDATSVGDAARQGSAARRVEIEGIGGRPLIKIRHICRALASQPTIANPPDLCDSTDHTLPLNRFLLCLSLSLSVRRCMRYARVDFRDDVSYRLATINLGNRSKEFLFFIGLRLNR